MLLRPAALAAVVCGLLCAAPASAATITVTTTADTVAADGQTSLREAVTQAYDAGEHRVVVVPAGTYPLGSPLMIDDGPGASVTIRGAGARSTVLDGQDATAIAIVTPGATATLTDLTIAHGYAAEFGAGGLWNHGVTRLERVTVRDSYTGEHGGGLANQPGATLEVVRSTIARNIADHGGPESGPDSRRGGGIYNLGTLSLRLSTVAGNLAIGAIGGGSGSAGGGLYTNGPVALDHVTFSGNRASLGAGGNVFNGGGSVNVLDSLLVGGLPQNCNAGLSRPSSGDRSLADDATCAITTTTAAFEPLANNGGPTDTVALTGGSPAVDSAETCTGDVSDPLNTSQPDQRGLPRPSGAACDVGAYELQAPASTSAPPSGDRDEAAPPAGPPVLRTPGPEAAVPPLAPVSSLRLHPARFVAGSGRRRGTRVSYRLGAPATVRFRVEKLIPGRRVSGRCVQPRRENRARAGCTRRVWVKGSLLRVSPAGVRTFRFSGRIGGRTLRPGRYSLVAVVELGGRRSVARRAAFVVVRG